MRTARVTSIVPTLITSLLIIRLVIFSSIVNGAQVKLPQHQSFAASGRVQTSSHAGAVRGLSSEISLVPWLVLRRRLVTTQGRACQLCSGVRRAPHQSDMCVNARAHGAPRISIRNFRVTERNFMSRRYRYNTAERERWRAGPHRSSRTCRAVYGMALKL